MSFFQFKPEMIDSIYDYAKLYYECGDYSTASQYLNLHNELVPSTDKVAAVLPFPKLEKNNY